MDCSGGGATTSNWTELVEDLLHVGEIDKAISLLEFTISNLEKQSSEKELQNTDNDSLSFSVTDQLSTALQDLSKLYSAKGLSPKADQALFRAFQLKHRKGGLRNEEESTSKGSSEALVSNNEATTCDKIRERGYSDNVSNVDGYSQESCADDDWEALVDHTPDELLPQPQQCLPEVSTLSLEDSKEQTTKRRGRGTFAYKKQGLYSDEQLDEPVVDSDNNPVHYADDQEKGNHMYGTHHVLVLADFPPSTRTSDLEKLFDKFKDQFVIRWVNDTLALAVFRTPSVAQEASKFIQCSFSVRILDEGDELLISIPPKDLKPPRQRPQTSARTAQRLIAQGMGIKLPTSFGSTELRKQEEARKNRIVSRQNMRDDAWGDDVN